jgi:hypothetical protein
MFALHLSQTSTGAVLHLSQTLTGAVDSMIGDSIFDIGAAFKTGGSVIKLSITDNSQIGAVMMHCTPAAFAGG